MVFKLLYLKKERVNVSTILISIQLSQQLSFEQLQTKKQKQKNIDKKNVVNVRKKKKN